MVKIEQNVTLYATFGSASWYMHSFKREHFTEVVPNDARNPLIWANLESINRQMTSYSATLQSAITFCIFGVTQNKKYLGVSTARELSFPHTFRPSGEAGGPIEEV